MGVPEVGSGVGGELVSERVALRDWTLGDERYSVRILGASLVDTVPMDGVLQTVHGIADVDYHAISLTHLMGRRGK